jgi:TRAP-type C4-dicarboxylate transport system permease small subunit
MLRWLETLSSAVDAFIRGFITVDLGLIILLVLGEVLSRNLLNFSFYWLEEVTMTFLGTWLVFLGASHAMKVGLLVSMDFLVTRLPRPVALVCSLTSHLGILLFLSVLIVYSARLAHMASAQSSPALQISMAFAYLPIVVGACLMSLHTIVGLGRLVSGARAS